ncbi:hypothetical protein VP01_1223g5 [Puccinia sorghi]|uniref:Uncharacterized protein n=1 Tax=Puccinia sorghi TaxID=27349 RepID=A0A0L6VQ11_9BASI|nr:hypothetical protein VP01_1223g5 [Puccinia sorghi]
MGKIDPPGTHRKSGKKRARSGSRRGFQIGGKTSSSSLELVGTQSSVRGAQLCHLRESQEEAVRETVEFIALYCTEADSLCPGAPGCGPGFALLGQQVEWIAGRQPHPRAAVDTPEHNHDSNYTMTKQVPLFGGAITIDLPSDIIDVRYIILTSTKNKNKNKRKGISRNHTFRQVPDTQEVFITRNEVGEESGNKNGTRVEMQDLSMIIEVLERVDVKDLPMDQLPSADPDALLPQTIIKYHFDSLAHDNSSDLATIKCIELPQDRTQFGAPVTIEPTSGTGRTPEPVSCYGLQSISKFNASKAESHEVHIWLALWRLNGVGNNGKGTDLVLTFNLPHLPASHPPHFQRSLEHTHLLFQHSAQSLRIVDWTLFA